MSQNKNIAFFCSTIATQCSPRESDLAVLIMIDFGRDDGNGGS